MLALLILLAPVPVGSADLRTQAPIDAVDVSATHALVVDDDGVVYRFSLATGQGSRLELDRLARHAVFLGDGFVTAGSGLTRRIRRYDNGQPGWVFEAPASVTALASHGSTLAFGVAGGDVWVGQDGALDTARRLGTTSRRPQVLRFSPDGARLLVADSNKVARVFDVATGAAVDLVGLGNLTDSVAFDGASVLGSSGVRGDVGLLPVQRRGVPKTLKVGLFAGAVALDARYVVVAQTRDRRDVLWWRRPGLQPGKPLDTGGVIARHLHLLPDGRLVAALEHRLWVVDLATGVERPPAPGPVTAVRSLAFGPDGNLYVADRGAVRAYDPAGRALAPLRGARDQEGIHFISKPADRLEIPLGLMRSVAVVAGGVVATGDDEQLSRWEKGARVRARKGGRWRVWLAAAGDVVVTGDRHGLLQVWPASVEAPKHTLELGHEIETLAVHPDGRWAAAGDRTLTVGRAGKKGASIEVDVASLAWAGDTLVGCADTLTRYDAKLAATPTDHPCTVATASADGETLAIGYDGALTLLRAGKRVGGARPGPITALAFSSDGARLAVGRPDARAEIWTIVELVASAKP